MTSLDQAMLELTETALKVKAERDAYRAALEKIAELNTERFDAINQVLHGRFAQIALEALQKGKQ